MRIAITGSKGQLGSALQRVLVADELLLLDLPEHDLTDLAATLGAIAAFQPEVIIHTAALTDVDGCERNPELAYRVNVLGTRNVAVAAQQCGASLVYISTDYVFDGTKGAPYWEYDDPHPLSVYGRTKWLGEQVTRDLAQRFNAAYGPTFVVPQAAIPRPGRGARIMNLADPTRKMSKTTDLPAGVVGLFDDPAEIERKIKRAVTDTDSGPGSVRYDRDTKPGVSNLLELLATLRGDDPDRVADGYSRYGDLKADVARAVLDAIEPIQLRFRELSARRDYVSDVLATGARRANEVASATLARSYSAIGL